MTNQKRIGALILCIGLTLVLAVSAAFPVSIPLFRCSGTDCRFRKTQSCPDPR